VLEWYTVARLADDFRKLTVDASPDRSDYIPPCDRATAVNKPFYAVAGS